LCNGDDGDGRERVLVGKAVIDGPAAPQSLAVRRVLPASIGYRGLTRAGEVVGDPFACTGTIGVALKAAGGHYYVGTEIDADNARVGQGRMAAQQEGVRTVIDDDQGRNADECRLVSGMVKASDGG
jgi:hypothetical protein